MVGNRTVGGCACRAVGNELRAAGSVADKRKSLHVLTLGVVGQIALGIGLGDLNLCCERQIADYVGVVMLDGDIAVGNGCNNRLCVCIAVVVVLENEGLNLGFVVNGILNLDGCGELCCVVVNRVSVLVDNGLIEGYLACPETVGKGRLDNGACAVVILDSCCEVVVGCDINVNGLCIKDYIGNIRDKLGYREVACALEVK